MIEICFSAMAETVLGTMKDKLKSSAVFCLGEYFNLGNLEKPVAERTALINAEKCRYCYSDFTQEDFDGAYQTTLEHYQRNMAQFKTMLNNGDTVRIWINKNASDYSGLCWFCYTFKDCTNPLHIVTRSEYSFNPFQQQYENACGWSGMPEDWIDLVRVKEVNQREREYYARRWEILLKENTPLRIMLDEEVISVENNFFDEIILKSIPSEPQAQGKLMGRIVGKWPLDLAFVAQRIERLIEIGKITVYEDIPDEEGYQWPRTIAKV